MRLVVLVGFLIALQQHQDGIMLLLQSRRSPQSRPEISGSRQVLVQNVVLVVAQSQVDLGRMWTAGKTTDEGQLRRQGRFRPFLGRIDPIPAPSWMLPGLSPIGANDQIDLGAWYRAIPGSNAPALLTDFQGVLQTTSIPPDPIMAAGPNHLMGLVNRRFAIFSKAGANEDEIDAPPVLSGSLP